MPKKSSEKNNPQKTEEPHSSVIPCPYRAFRFITWEGTKKNKIIYTGLVEGVHFNGHEIRITPKSPFLKITSSNGSEIITERDRRIEQLRLMSPLELRFESIKLRTYEPYELVDASRSGIVRVCMLKQGETMEISEREIDEMYVHYLEKISSTET